MVTGEMKPKKKVVGGISTNIAKYPFTISLRSKEDHMCGGILIKEDWILTAAHCLMMASECYMKLRKAIFYQALAGTTFSDDKTKVGQIKQCIYFYTHPEYDPETLMNDIGLVQIESPFRTGENVQVAKISNYYEKYAGDDVPENTNEIVQ
ncbi:trypsin-like [Ctenocephalides felis]|uniref:trypsin-like n=1 Tax=Ctenocephalides felis TaxID=7515 RepID=UPI000E6E30D4|nr:trypsin-like [Ctenocephalides felis]